MRSTTRRFLAAILLTGAAGFALSQEAGAPPPPPAPDAAAPVAELPQLPVASVPANASANTAPVKSDVPATVAVKSAIPETPAESGSRSRSSLIIGEWLLAGVLLVVLFGIAQLLRRRGTPRRTRLIDLKSLELKPRPLTTRL